MEIKQSNPSALQALNERVNGLQGVQGRVGWFESAQYEDGTPVALAAASNEFGHGPVPPRPFFRTTRDEKQKEWIGVATAASKQVLKGAIDGMDAMELLTIKAQNDVLVKIKDITEPPLSKLTLGMRKYKELHPNEKITGATLGLVSRLLAEGKLDISGVSTKPLVDSGTMVSTLDHKVSKT